MYIILLSVISILFASSSVSAFQSAFDEDLYERVLDEAACQRQLTAIANHSLLLRFIDASGKLPSGILQGNTYSLGDYEECLSLNDVVNDQHIEGKYCMLQVPVSLGPLENIQEPNGTLSDVNISWPDVNVASTDVNVTWPDGNVTSPDISVAWPDMNVTLLVQPVEARNVELLRRWVRAYVQSDEITNGRSLNRELSRLASNLNLNIAVCVPRACTPRMALAIVQQMVPVNLTFTESFCRLPDDKPLAAADYVAFVIFSIIGVLIIVSTSYDLHHIFVLKHDASKASALYRSFSVYTNTRRFLTFKSTPGALECLDGIRAISMLWVIVGHTYVHTLMGYVHNWTDILDWMSAFSSVWVIAAPITVDTFFLLSAILLVYSSVGKLSRNRFIRSIPLFYVHRLLRMFPLLAAVVLLQASWLHHVADGPGWRTVGASTERCRRYWWAALLHLQNYLNQRGMCLGQTWYLSVDVQLYIASPLVLVWLMGPGRFAWLALSAALFLSLVASSVYSFFYGFSAAIVNIGRIGEIRDYVRLYYFNTLPRAAPFCVGLIVGYVLHLYRDRNFIMSKKTSALLWLLSLLAMCFCVVSIYPVSQPDHSAQLLDDFLNAYMRAIWAVALGYLIFACVKGYGGPVNWFLSLRMWKLPARLSYAMYLLHYPIMTVSAGARLAPLHFTNANTMYRFVADTGFTALAAFVLCIAIDAPCSTLQKLLLQGLARQSRRTNTESKETIADSNGGGAGAATYIKTS